MHDLRRPTRRLTKHSFLPRALAHLVVVAVVVSASAAGISAGRAESSPVEPTDLTESFAFGLITTARGAAASAEPMEVVRLEIEPDPEREILPLSRRMVLPSASPLPTPIPPSETPIPDPPTTVEAPPPAPARTAAAPPPPPPPPPAPAPAAPTARLAWPVPGGSVSQYFHAGHLALDIAAPHGSTVVAAADGIVISAGWTSNGGGMVVAIDHGNGLVTRYNHLGSIWVSPGQWVARGQGIAGVGCTGICTGPHVHFETIVNGVAINPLRLL